MRAAAVYQILAHPSELDRQKVQTTLLECLEYEDRVLDGTLKGNPDPFSDETYGDNYMSALEGAVLDIAHKTRDQRAFDALIRSAYNDDSELGKELVNRIENLPTLMDVAKGSGVGGRMSALSIIGSMLEASKKAPQPLIPASSYRDAKKLLTEAAGNASESPLVRGASVRALSRIADRDDLVLLQRLAASDSSSCAGTDGLQHYPIRDEAVKGVNSILSKATLEK